MDYTTNICSFTCPLLDYRQKKSKNKLFLRTEGGFERFCSVDNFFLVLVTYNDPDLVPQFPQLVPLPKWRTPRGSLHPLSNFETKFAEAQVIETMRHATELRTRVRGLPKGSEDLSAWNLAASRAARRRCKVSQHFSPRRDYAESIVGK